MGACSLVAIHEEGLDRYKKLGRADIPKDIIDRRDGLHEFQLARCAGSVGGSGLFIMH